MLLVPVFMSVAGAIWITTLTLAYSIDQIAVAYVGILGLAAAVRALSQGVEDIDWYLLPVCLLGPLGVIAALTTHLTKSRQSVDVDQLQCWYEELRGANGGSGRSFANDVSLGRISPQPSASMRSAIEIFRDGSFRDRQRVLMWIARRKDASLKSLLEHAIRCDDTIIRSQAASLIVHFETAERSPTASAANDDAALQQGLKRPGLAAR
jgi:hypothetical protein